MKKRRMMSVLTLISLCTITGCSSSSTSDTKATATSSTALESTSEIEESAEATSETTSCDTGKECLFCGLCYSGSEEQEFINHVVACAENAFTNESVKTWPYCGLEYTGDDVTGFTEHIAACASGGEEEVTMCQKCGEYYQVGTEHVCPKDSE